MKPASQILDKHRKLMAETFVKRPMFAPDAFEAMEKCKSELYCDWPYFEAILEREAAREAQMLTHGPECWKSGPQHWECAVRKIEEMEKENDTDSDS